MTEMNRPNHHKETTITASGLLRTVYAILHLHSRRSRFVPPLLPLVVLFAIATHCGQLVNAADNGIAMAAEAANAGIVEEDETTNPLMTMLMMMLNGKKQLIDDVVPNSRKEQEETTTTTTTPLPPTTTTVAEAEETCDIYENGSLHALMERICELCHDMFSHLNPNTRAECRSGCFRSTSFKRCLRLFKPIGAKAKNVQFVNAPYEELITL